LLLLLLLLLLLRIWCRLSEDDRRMVNFHVLAVLLRIDDFALADPAGEAGERVRVHVARIVQRVARLVLAVLALQLSTLK
jgi:hypothetical protein